jgi:SAM-dependent methyltransferase
MTTTASEQARQDRRQPPESLEPFEGRANSVPLRQLDPDTPTAPPGRPEPRSNAAASYVFRGGAEGKARLRIISDALWPTTLDLLTRAGIHPGMACLDVGCGGGHVTLEMARLVGPTGAVTGIDRDAVAIQLVQQAAEQQRLANTRLLTLDVAQLDFKAQFDLVYARLLLTHLTDPANALQRMREATKPGGVIVVEDIDHSGSFSYPECPAVKRFVSLYNQAVRLKGADPEIGPKLPALFRQVGLPDLHLSHVQPVFVEGDIKGIHQINLQNIAPAVMAAGLATEAEINALLSELDAFVQDPETLVSAPHIFQVWAHRT